MVKGLKEYELEKIGSHKIYKAVDQECFFFPSYEKKSVFLKQQEH